MEIRLFLGKIPHTFIVSKFIKHFIISLEDISRVLGKPNDFEVMKVDRSGKLFNFIIETNNKDSAAIVEVKDDTGLRFHAKNRGSYGFSSFVACFPEEHIPKGVITLIAKKCDKVNYTGYYLNSFWGYPVEPEPFTPNLEYTKMKESAKFWETKAYRCEGRSIDLSQILIPYSKYSEYSPEDFKQLDRALGTHLSFIGRCDLSEAYQQTLIAPEGFYAVLRGNHG